MCRRKNIEKLDLTYLFDYFGFRSDNKQLSDCYAFHSEKIDLHRKESTPVRSIPVRRRSTFIPE